MIFYVTKVTILLTLIMNKWADIVMNDWIIEKNKRLCSNDRLEIGFMDSY